MVVVVVVVVVPMMLGSDVAWGNFFLAFGVSHVPTKQGSTGISSRQPGKALEIASLGDGVVCREERKQLVQVKQWCGVYAIKPLRKGKSNHKTRSSQQNNIKTDTKRHPPTIRRRP